MQQGSYWRIAVLGCALSLGLASAQAAQGDDRILEARDAAAKADIARLQVLAAKPSNNVLNPYVEYWLLSARIARPSEANPNDAVQQFLRDQAGTNLADRLRSDWLKRLAREKNWTLFDQQYPQLVQADQDLQCSAQQRSGDTATMAAQWLTLSETPESCNVIFRELVITGRMKEEDVWWRFRRLVEERRQSAASEALKWLDINPAPLAVAFSSPSRYLASAAGKNTSTRASREIAMAAVVRMSRSDIRDTIGVWKGIESQGFRSEERAYMWGQLGWMAAKSQLPEAAEWMARAKKEPMSEDQAAWYARSYLRKGDWQGLHDSIQTMPTKLAETPDWTYWLARAYIELGRSKDATPLFKRYAGEANFYGILSAEALGGQFVWPSPVTPSTPAEMAEVRSAPELQRALALMRLDMRTEGIREWAWWVRTASDRQLIAASDYARREDHYDRAINTAERTKGDHDFSLRYLAPYYDVFSAQARAQNVDLAWVYGLVRQESRFYHIARSGVGAQGLMQIMPATGKWLAKNLGETGYQQNWLNDIDRNVQFGTAYMRHVLDGLDNSPLLASAAYNAGPSRARRWRETRALEGAVYAETIPFNETRDYVKKVMANAVIYATLFDGKSPLLGTRLGYIAPRTESVASNP